MGANTAPTTMKRFSRLSRAQPKGASAADSPRVCY